MRALTAYKKVLSVMPQDATVEHICGMTLKYGDKATAIFSLIFDDFNVFADEESPQIVAAKFLDELNEEYL